jgi:hypothetical protein
VRARVLRERVLVLRFAVLRERDAVLRGFAAVVERFAVERFAVDLLRDAEVPVDLAPAGFFAAALLRVAVERDFARDVVLRLPADRRAVLRAGVAAADSSSAVHLPDITRCAASATASAMIEPNLVALVTTLLAACCAVSAASSPASRIALRAFGLALIAAAAAASPAASISLLIAAFASLSTVLFLDFEVEPEDDLEDVLLADFAIALSPSVQKTL